jgi:hypothetical protein
MEGIISDEGDVRLGVFAGKLDDFRILFDEAQTTINSDIKTELLISNLTHNSPSATTMRTPDPSGAKALSLIIETLHQINQGHPQLVSNEQFEFYEKLRAFCKTNFSKLGSMWLSAYGKVLVSINKETISSLDNLLLSNIESIGSIKGVVEGYNSHSQDKYFYLYPLIGGRVKCIFGEEQRQEAANTVDRNVLVHGKLKFHGGGFIPYEVEVSHMEILPLNTDLPRLVEITLDESQIESESVQRIRRLRDEW